MKKVRFKRETITRKLTIADAADEAFSELSSLGEEMREAFDNTPESLQGSGVGQAREEAADALEEINEPDINEEIGKWEFEHTTRTAPPREQSRPWRRDEIVGLLDQAIDFLQTKLEEIEHDLGWAGLAEDSEQRTKLEDRKMHVDSTIDELENMKSDAEGVEFPGMYG